MKCRLTEKKDMKAMLTGLVMAVIGALASYLLPEEAHLAMRIAGFVSGVGSSMAIIGGAVLLRRARMDEKRARDSELTMTDERGLAVAYKAQNIAAIAAIFAMIAVDIAALMRGDSFYMWLISMLLCAVALIKLAAWYIYNRTM